MSNRHPPPPEEQRAHRWRDFARAAPELGSHGEALLSRRSVALLATLRPDGSPRISPIEPYFVAGHLLVGAMSWSQKATDLRRDHRFALHSTVMDVNGSEGEFQIFGEAELVVDEQLRHAADAAWWVSQPSRAADVYSLCVRRAVCVAWDLECGEMIVQDWSSTDGTSERRRSYP